VSDSHRKERAAHYLSTLDSEIPRAGAADASERVCHSVEDLVEKQNETTLF